MVPVSATNSSADGHRSGSRLSACLRALFVLIVITLPGVFPANVAAQQVSTEALPDNSDANGSSLPLATVISPVEDQNSTPEIIAERQSRVGDVYTLEGHVLLRYRKYELHADRVQYNDNTGDAIITGNLLLTGGEDDESISASHAQLNLQTETGRFYDVSGTVGMHNVGSRVFYTSGNPFIFGGKLVVKSGPVEYHVYQGWVTSCQLPRPDWQLFAGEIDVNAGTGGRARARNSIFHLANLPILYLPYVTHPVDPEARESGIWTPVFGQSNTKGFVLGEQFYIVLGRSADMTIGAQYFSRRGWEQSATFRYIGANNDFARFRYNGVVDRGYIQKNGGYTNQGGEDVSFTGRHDFTDRTRIVVDTEYLSSYVYREAFAGNFNQAVSSDVLSTGYLVHQWNGYSVDGRIDRYQGLKRVPIPATPTSPGTAGQQVRILHVPSLDFMAVDHRLGKTPFFWNAESSAAGLKRVQPNFVTGGVVERYDLHPQFGLTFNRGGWFGASSAALRDTIYSRSRANTFFISQSDASLHRADVEFQVDLRPPVVERTFHTPALRRILGTELRHTIEPAFTYRNVRGVGDQFNRVLRFDDIDIVSDTNEVQYGVTQHLYARGGHHRNKNCPAEMADSTPAYDAAAAQPGGNNPDREEDSQDNLLRTGSGVASCDNQQREWMSWRLTQKLFIDPSFGGAVLSSSALSNRNRYIFSSTLDLSGIAFLTERREISPLISRLRIRTSNNIDLAWDFDLDTGAKKFTTNNIFLDAHSGNWRTEVSYARLNAPGRTTISTATGSATSLVSNFSQLRMLAGYGQTTKRGLSVAANAGYDLNLGGLQYGALQAAYNWDCCGLSVEYRKFELGTVRNEGSYRFSFTLANIGAAGNLRRAERLF